MKPQYQKDIARKRIEKLFKLANENFNDHPERSHRYIQLARKIAMKFNIRLSQEHKKHVCKKCYKYIVYGKNSRVRKNKKGIVITCLECGHVMRYPYERK